MLLLTALWGFQQVTVKWIAADVSLVMQAAIRSIVATAAAPRLGAAAGLALFAARRHAARRDRRGLLFAVEFVFIYGGLAHTNASRMSVFIYLAPPLTALGLHFFVRGERLDAGQWLGVALAFAGHRAGVRRRLRRRARHLARRPVRGDRGAVLWAATTVVIRATRLARASAARRCSISSAFPRWSCRSLRSCWGRTASARSTPLVRGEPRLPGRDRRLRELPRVVLAAHALPRGARSQRALVSHAHVRHGRGVVFCRAAQRRFAAAAALAVAAGIVLVNLRR